MAQHMKTSATGDEALRKWELPRFHLAWLVRSTALNFSAVLIPGIVGVVAIPIAITGLGTERYGAFSLAWVVLTYLTFFDFGLGRAATMHASALMAEAKLIQLRAFTWTAILLQLILAVGAAILLWVSIPFLVDNFFRFPTPLKDESQSLLRWLSASLVPLFMASLSRGLLEAARRFDLVNAVKIPSTALILAVPAAVALIHPDLGNIGLSVFFLQVGTAVAYALLVLRVLPNLTGNFAVKSHYARTLISYGGWITIYTILNVLVSSADRVVVGYKLPLQQVTYYTAPLDALMRLQVIPATISMTLFPIFSVSRVTRPEDTAAAYMFSLRFTTIMVGLPCALLIVFSSQFLTLWVGQQFAIHSSLVFGVLAAAILINSLAWLPCGFMLAANRPDIVAKLFFIDLAIYLPVLWLLVAANGIIGAGVAVLARSVVELVLFFVIPFRALPMPTGVQNVRRLAPLATFIIGTSAAGPVLNVWSDSTLLFVRVVIAAILAGFGWQFVLTGPDRVHLLDFVRQTASTAAHWARQEGHS